MGLYMIRARFAHAAPSEETFRRELQAELGSLGGLEGFESDGPVVEVRTMLDPVTRPYAIKVLERLGGQHLDARTLEPSDPKLPEFVSKPWHEVPAWRRASIRVRFQLGLLASALPTQRIL
jgi:hypothetical protein